MEQRPRRLADIEMTKYHSDDYINFLCSVSPDNINDLSHQLQRCTFARPVVVVAVVMMMSGWLTCSDAAAG